MKRPSYREIDRKLKAAKTAVKSGYVFIVKEDVITSDALELGFLEGIDLFAFQVKSTILDCDVYYKFAIKGDCFLLGFFAWIGCGKR
jgi:hypothetical protein